jgi:RNA polymerase sigma-70 factor (ECF subfamily)
VREAEVEGEVLRRFAAGDDAAFSAVYRRYSGPMFTVALRTLGRREWAAEAVQQAFLQAWRAAGSFNADADIAPWLFTITHRAAVDVWRRERQHGLVGADDQVVEGVVAGPSLDSAWEAWQVRLAVQELPETERDVVRLAYLEDLTHGETATRLGIPVGTVKSRSHRAHARLRALLSHLAPEQTGAPEQDGEVNR